MTAASTAALAVGLTEMMYLAFAPRSRADVGTAVKLSEMIVSRTRIDTRNFAIVIERMSAPRVVHFKSVQHLLYNGKSKSDMSRARD
jgi:hypothetical protein